MYHKKGKSMAYQTRADLQQIIDQKDANIEALEERHKRWLEQHEELEVKLNQTMNQLIDSQQINAHLTVQSVSLVAKLKQTEKLFKAVLKQVGK
jgi:uncharacterized protein YhaN